MDPKDNLTNREWFLIEQALKKQRFTTHEYDELYKKIADN